MAVVNRPLYACMLAAWTVERQAGPFQTSRDLPMPYHRELWPVGVHALSATCLSRSQLDCRVKPADSKRKSMKISLCDQIGRIKPKTQEGRLRWRLVTVPASADLLSRCRLLPWFGLPWKGRGHSAEQCQGTAASLFCRALISLAIFSKCELKRASVALRTWFNASKVISRWSLGSRSPCGSSKPFDLP